MNGVIEDSRFSTMRVATRSRVCGLSGASRSARVCVLCAVHVEKRMAQEKLLCGRQARSGAALPPKGEGMPPYWGLYRVPRCPLLPAWTLAPAPVPREARRRKGCPAHGGLRLVYRDERDNEPSRPPPPARSHSSGIRGSDNIHIGHCVEGRADVAKIACSGMHQRLNNA